MTLTVGVSDMKVSDDPEAVLVTYSLGSCIGIAIYDAVVRVGGNVNRTVKLAVKYGEVTMKVSGRGEKKICMI